jgi:hypothetical protein
VVVVVVVVGDVEEGVEVKGERPAKTSTTTHMATHARVSS